MRSDRRLPALFVALTIASAVGCADFRRGAPGEPEPETIVDIATDGGAAGGASFAAGVHQLLVGGCLSCHSDTGAASDTSWVLSGDADADYVETIPLIDESDPDGSRLVTKALGSGHQGGAVFRRGSTEHTSLLNWIHQGALP